jgi:predicted kinase
MAKLYLFVGYPGAGKTTIAQLISDRTGAVHIWADQERKKMFGEPEHSREENAKLYGYLNKKTAELLAGGQSVIFDTNFNFRKDRDHLSRIAEENNAEAQIIWVTTPKHVAKSRAVDGPSAGPTRVFGNMSDKTFERIASHLEEPSENEKIIKIDGAELDPDTAARILGL